MIDSSSSDEAADERLADVAAVADTFVALMRTSRGRAPGCSPPPRTTWSGPRTSLLKCLGDRGPDARQRARRATSSPTRPR